MQPELPPGLTCAVCHDPLYPENARRTDDGWRHADKTSKCQSRLAERQHAEKRDARNEDLRWMAETGETFSGAAKRLGLGNAALDRWFRLHPMPDVKAALLARDPGATTGRQKAAT